MLYVLPIGTKVIGRKQAGQANILRDFKLREQMTFGEEDLAEVQNPREWSFRNGDWTLTAKRKDVQTI